MFYQKRVTESQKIYFITANPPVSGTVNAIASQLKYLFKNIEE